MVSMNIEMEAMLREKLRTWIEEEYKKQFEKEPDKIPNIKDVELKWWSRLTEKVKDNIKNIYSDMHTYSEDDRQLSKKEIFKNFQKFYDEMAIVNINDDNVKPFDPTNFDESSHQKTTEFQTTPDKNKADIVTNKSNLIIERNKTSSPNPSPPIVKRTEPIKELTPYHLKNGVVGKEFNEILDFKKLYPEGEISDFSIDGLDKIGLNFNKKTFVIHGVPKEAGDPTENYEFEITIRFETDKNTKESRKIFIKISPDPKSLWKTLEPPETLGDPKSHEYSKLISLQNGDQERNLLCASKRGRSHAHKATYRDDDIKIDYLTELGWAIIAVADGAGSAKLSRVGSQIACEKSIDYISKRLGTENKNLDELIKKINKEKSAENEALLQKSLFKILAHAAYTSAQGIQTEAGSRKLSINDFHTTLLLAIHKQYDFGHFIAGFWIGDGALAIYKNKEPVILLGSPDGGQYSGQTVFLTMKKYLETEELAKRIRYHIVQDFTAIVAMSDGVSDPEFGTDKNLFDHTCWDKFWEKLQNQFKSSNEKIDKTLLNWLDFWAEGEHDDRSIAILY